MHQHTSRFLVQGFRPTSTPLKLSLLGLIGLGAICSLLFPSSTLAAPTAEWTTPWNVTLGSKSGDAIASNSRAFGASSTADGQITDLGSFGEALPGTGADAKSESSVVSSGPLASLSTASTSVSFNRSFSLNGSPGGWDLSFNGALEGNLSAVSADGQLPQSAKASAIANAGISGAGPLSSPSVNIIKESLQARTITNGTASFAPVENHFSATGFVGDGTYDVSGSLTTSASLGPNTSSATSSAIAGFFDSFTVSVDATPVPETINLVGVFAIVGFCGYIWFRRKAGYQNRANGEILY